METVAAIVPIKTRNERMPGKNTRKLNGIPLFEYLFTTLQQTKCLTDVFVDSSDEFILAAAKSYGFQTIKRPEELNGPLVQGNDLLAFELQGVSATIVGQFFVTSPFIKGETIECGVSTLLTDNGIDSIFGVVNVYNRYWFNGKPINHNYDKLVGTQHMKPIQCEADFYLVRRKAFLREKSRITQRNKTIIVSAEEAIDIDTEMDFLIAEAICHYRSKPGVMNDH